MALVVVAALAPSALAARGPAAFFGGTGTTGGKFPLQLGGIDVNQAGTGGASAGDLYVADRGGHRIQQFSSGGAFVRAFGLDVGGAGVDVCTTAALCGVGTSSGAAGGLVQPEGIAVEQATGNVYVADSGAHRVDVFSATGTFEGGFGWHVNATTPAEELQFCVALSDCQTGSSGSGAGQFAAHGNGEEGLTLALSPATGNVIIGDAENRRVSEIAPTLSGGVVTGVSFVRAYGWGAGDGSSEFQICTSACHAPAPLEPTAEPGQFGKRAPGGVSADGSGRVYTSETQYYEPALVGYVGANRIQIFDSAGAPLGDFPAELSTLRPTGALAVDRSTGALAVADFGNKGIDEFSSSGALLAELMPRPTKTSGISSTEGLAFDETSGDIYVTNDSALNPFLIAETRGVFVIGEPVPPSATIEPPTEVAGTSAKLRGTVDPEGFFTSYHFEYSPDGSEWTATSPKNLPADSSPHSVEEPVSGLEALTEYQVRLVAEKAFGGGSAEDETSFETSAAPPVVSAVSVSDITDVTAMLSGTVNPENQATTYEFQYVTEQKFTESGFAEASSAAGNLPAGGAAVQVSAVLHGLTPKTSYVVRLTAANGVPPAQEGEETAFTTFTGPLAGLPDGRAYEQASPIEKGGSDIEGNEYTVHAGENGDAISFYVNGGLPNAGETGGQQFPSYVAHRASGGWSSRGVLPPSTLGRHATLVGWSEDGSRTYSVVGKAGSEALYRRDMKSGQETLIATGVEAESKGFVSTNVAGESADGGVVVFESYSQLLPKARKNKPNVYAWNAHTGQVSLVSVLPSGVSPVVGAFAGPYDWAFGSGLGGPSAGYYTGEEAVVSADGSSVYFTDAITSQVYLRKLNSSETVQVSASQKTNGSGAGGTDPLGPKAAAFLGASSDGSKAFFLSSEQLTNNATTGPGDEGRDLYRYDAASGTLADLVSDETDPNGAEVQAFLGASADGSTAYFLANGVLAAGAELGTCNGGGEGHPLPGSGECNLYVWRSGQIALVAKGLEVTLKTAGNARNWLPTNASGGNSLLPKTATVSPDGRTLLFTSSSPLTSYDAAGHDEVYRYRFGAGIQCVSCSPTGLPATSDAVLHEIPHGFTAALPPNSPSRLRNMSRSGDRIVFQSAERLAPGDENSTTDVYEWEADETGSCGGEAVVNGGCLFLISTGLSSRPSYFADADAELKNIFFLTSQQLVGQDTDELVDMYDARIGGGLAGQNPPPPALPCAGEEACRGPAQAAPASSTRGSETFVGPGNAKPRPHKHKHRRHRRHHHHRKKGHGKKRHGKKRGGRR